MAGEATKIPFIEAAAPSTPAANRVVIYAKADGLMYSKDDAGAETLMSAGASGSVATDAIWDAAGDLAVGTGANTAARLAKGAAGANLSQYNGVVGWNGGTSFPATPATGDRYWRSDLGMEFYYDGTRWLSSSRFSYPIGIAHGTAPISASAAPSETASFPAVGVSAIYVETVTTVFYVDGGTALGASHKWVGTLVDGTTSATLATINVDSGASSAWRNLNVAANAAVASTSFMQHVSWTKTGTPGNLYFIVVVLYRLTAT